VKENGEALYNVFPPPRQALDSWVTKNVVPHLNSGTPSGIWPLRPNVERFQKVLQEYLQKEEGEIRIVTDWPDDVKYLSELLITGPGTMMNIPGIVFEVKRVMPTPMLIRLKAQYNTMLCGMPCSYGIA
jgi:hypothetical protein